MAYYYKNVEGVIYDWFATNEVGEEYKRYEVGKNNVKEIQYHTPVGEGDRHYCDIYFDNTDNVKRIFNINEIWGSNLE